MMDPDSVTHHPDVARRTAQSNAHLPNHAIRRNVAWRLCRAPFVALGKLTSQFNSPKQDCVKTAPISPLQQPRATVKNDLFSTNTVQMCSRRQLSFGEPACKMSAIALWKDTSIAVRSPVGHAPCVL